MGNSTSVETSVAAKSSLEVTIQPSNLTVGNLKETMESSNFHRMKAVYITALVEQQEKDIVTHALVALEDFVYLFDSYLRKHHLTAENYDRQIYDVHKRTEALRARPEILLDKLTDALNKIAIASMHSASAELKLDASTKSMMGKVLDFLVEGCKATMRFFSDLFSDKSFFRNLKQTIGEFQGTSEHIFDVERNQTCEDFRTFLSQCRGCLSKIQAVFVTAYPTEN